MNNALKDFGKASCSKIEQDKSASTKCREVVTVAKKNEVDKEQFQAIVANNPASVASLNHPSNLMSLSSADRPSGRDKVVIADSNPNASLPWWDDKAIEQERSKVGSLQDRQPTFEIGQQIPDLHGFRGIDPANQRKYEKYEHRIIAELKAGGRTNQEICEITGYCASSVASIVKLPWVKQFVMDEIHKHGGQAVVDYMSQHAMPAAETVVSGFMDEEMPRGRDRVAAANSLLDRLFGKANQNIVNHKGADLDKLSDNELAAMLPNVNGNS